MFRTEHDFTLPMGYIDEHGSLLRSGTMRLATAADEIEPLRDPRVVKNEAYLVILLLSRVVTRLDGVDQITPRVISGLFAADLAHLQKLYNRINRVDDEEDRSVMCPNCSEAFDPEVQGVGGSSATPSIT